MTVAGRADAAAAPLARPGTSRPSVGVAGSGTMASGIAEVFAKAGYEVVLAARSEEKAADGQGPYRQVASHAPSTRAG